jgi:hypothetical protein
VARTSTLVEAAPDAVWAVLADGWLYPTWVVGTVKIRDVDPHWPEAGAKLHHAVGAWPLTLQDETEVVESQPGRLLRMQARGWPLGEATIEVTLTAVGSATTVELYEEPTSGPGAWLNNRVVEVVGRARLDEMLDRLRRLVEGHAGVDVA